MTVKLLGAACATLILSACAHSYPDLATFPAQPLDTSDELGQILQEAARLQGEYSKGYKETAQWQDLSQLPVIGGAAVAAWILLNDKDKAAKRAGKVGIGTLAFVNARDQFTASGMDEAFIAGHGALTCIQGEGSVFHGQKAQNRFRAHQGRLKQVSDGLALVTRLRNTEPSSPPPAPPSQPAPPSYAELLKGARTVADQAMAAARTAQATGLAQESAFETAAPVFRGAVSSVSVRVASKGRVRPPVEFGSLRDQMGAPSKSGSADAAAASLGEDMRADVWTLREAPPDPATLVQWLSAATDQLMQHTTEMTAGTPNYTKSLDRVREDCVKLAPAG